MSSPLGGGQLPLSPWARHQTLTATTGPLRDLPGSARTLASSSTRTLARHQAAQAQGPPGPARVEMWGRVGREQGISTIAKQRERQRAEARAANGAARRQREAEAAGTLRVAITAKRHYRDQLARRVRDLRARNAALQAQVEGIEAERLGSVGRLLQRYGQCQASHRALLARNAAALHKARQTGHDAAAVLDGRLRADQGDLAAVEGRLAALVEALRCLLRFKEQGRFDNARRIRCLHERLADTEAQAARELASLQRHMAGERRAALGLEAQLTRQLFSDLTEAAIEQMPGTTKRQALDNMGMREEIGAQRALHEQLTASVRALEARKARAVERHLASARARRLQRHPLTLPRAAGASSPPHAPQAQHTSLPLLNNDGPGS